MLEFKQLNNFILQVATSMWVAQPRPFSNEEMPGFENWTNFTLTSSSNVNSLCAIGILPKTSLNTSWCRGKRFLQTPSFMSKNFCLLKNCNQSWIIHSSAGLSLLLANSLEQAKSHRYHLYNLTINFARSFEFDYVSIQVNGFSTLYHRSPPQRGNLCMTLPPLREISSQHGGDFALQKWTVRSYCFWSGWRPRQKPISNSKRYICFTKRCNEGTWPSRKIKGH